jgi:hypothetical protein
MLVFVNESVFVETYHYGRPGVGGLQGGKVPVLEFHSDSTTYQELRGHFEHVWFKSRKDVLNEALSHRVEMAERDKNNIAQLKREFTWLSEAGVQPSGLREDGGLEPAGSGTASS